MNKEQRDMVGVEPPAELVFWFTMRHAGIKGLKIGVASQE